MKKILAGVFVMIVLAAAGIGVWIYSSLDSIVKAAIEEYVPPITQTNVKVGAARLSPADGAGHISNFTLGNPKGFRTAHALSAGAIEIAVEPASLARDVILIRRIAVAAPSINYETSDAGSNFDVIQRNVDKYLGPDRKKDKEPGKKMIIELLSIRDARLSYAPALLKGRIVDISLPDIELKNIGKDRGGVTGGQLAKTIIDALKSRITRSIADAARGIGEAAGKHVRRVTEGVKGLFGK